MKNEMIIIYGSCYGTTKKYAEAVNIPLDMALKNPDLIWYFVKVL